MQRIWWLNSTLCAKVHLMTFDLYNYQAPRWPDCRTSKKCSGDIGLSANNSAENSPWGRGGLLPAQSLEAITAKTQTALDGFAVDQVHNKSTTNRKPSTSCTTNLQQIEALQQIHNILTCRDVVDLLHLFI